MLKLVIWDMDGVVIDSEPIHNKISLAAYKKYGINLTDEEAMDLIGKSNKDIWSDFKEKYSLKETVEDLTKEELLQNIKYYNKNHAEPIKGVVDLLKELKETGIKVALASSSPMSFINLILDKLQIKEYFGLVLSGENFTKSKPDPQLFLAALDYFKVKPEEAVIIEDSNKGVIAAKRANINCVGFINKNSGNQDLSLADVQVEDLHSLCLKDLEDICAKRD
ncbi:HAD family phosphatase [Clostridium sp. KNHs214]|uniref:HAD family hydrolase n=1 Tax=Clostridium sp. KNHs214 TaxID=1540257 RepID=UPI0005556E0F|nr:HAD family phosphatase [Clostridium sp. KNHs214]